jgi:serine/threonine protein kinase
VSGRSGDLDRPLIERCLDEFDDHWDRGQRLRAASFLHRFVGDDRADFVELIYQEFCRSEAEGLKPDPAAFQSDYPEFRAALERLFAVHFGLIGPSGDTPSLEVSSKTVSMPRVGDSIGPFRLLQVLGQGGAGRVFLASQSDLGDRHVVAKVVPVGSTVEPEHQAAVSHPNIMPVFRHFRTDDGALLVVVMPYVEGASVDQWLQPPGSTAPTGGSAVRSKSLDRDRLAYQFAESDRDDWSGTGETGSSAGSRERAGQAWQKQVADWGARLARALAVAFRRGIVHGDVKPGNVFVSNDGIPYLLDFHLSRRWRFERHLAVLEQEDPGGTLPYLPPERLLALADRFETGKIQNQADRSLAAKYAHRGDLYGLALVLLELLTGECPEPAEPIEASQVPDAARRLAAGRLDPNWLRNRPGFSRLPKPWREFFRRALAGNPSQRHEDGFAFAQELRRLFPSETGRGTFAGRVGSRRNRVAAGMTCAAFVVAITWFVQAERRRADEVAALGWQTPYELWSDPSAMQERSIGSRLVSSRAEFERLKPLHGVRSNIRAFREMFASPRRLLESELWLADRIENLSRLTAERALRTASVADAESASKLLAEGSRRWSVDTWKKRERELVSRFGLAPSRPAGAIRENPIVSAYVELIGSSPEDDPNLTSRWNALIAREPEIFATRWGFARHAARIGQVGLAIDQLRSALALFPEHFEARRLLAHLQFRNGDFAPALQNIEMALRTRHDDLASLRIRAMLRLYAGQRADLEREIERMGEILDIGESAEGGSPDLGSANDRVKSGANDEKVESGSRDVLDTKTLERMLAHLPNDRQVKMLLVRKYSRERRFREALAMLEEMTGKGPRTTQDLVNLAILYRKSALKAKAVEVGIEIIRRDDLSDWLNYKSHVRNVCLWTIREVESTNRPLATELCRCLVAKSSDYQDGRGQWHFQLARLTILERQWDGIDEAVEQLRMAGTQHIAYLNDWYRHAFEFDPYRDAIDSKLIEVFPSSKVFSKRSK